MSCNDAHCHFFSASFFSRLGVQAGLPEAGADLEVISRLGWEHPGSDAELARKWVWELDRNKVGRAALMSSLPGDEGAVAAAAELFPGRIVGTFMVDATQQGLDDLLRHQFASSMRMACLFPAMHHFRLDSDPVLGAFEVAASAGCAVFVHCGILSVGIRKKLGLPSPFDVRLGNPLDLQRAASAFPGVPIVIPHFGAGFWREALVLATLHQNVYLDTSSSNGWIRLFPNLTLEQVFRTSLDVVGSGRLLFGTDSSFFPRGWQVPVHDAQRAIVDELGLSPDESAAIFSENFSQLFPLDSVDG